MCEDLRKLDTQSNECAHFSLQKALTVNLGSLGQHFKSSIDISKIARKSLKIGSLSTEKIYSYPDSSYVRSCPASPSCTDFFDQCLSIPTAPKRSQQAHL